MSKRGESWMPRRAGQAQLGLIFRVPLACAPGGSALPLGQLENGGVLEDAAFLDLEIQEHAGNAVPGLVVFQQPEIGLYQRLVESARNRLAELELELELEYGIEKSKVDSIRSKLFGALRESYQERDRLRLLVQFRGEHTRPRVSFSAPSLKICV